MQFLYKLSGSFVYQRFMKTSRTIEKSTRDKKKEMDLKKKIADYKAQKSKWGMISDAIFVVFIVLMLIPASRREIAATVNKLRVLIIQPSVEDVTEAPQLSVADFNWSIQRMGQPNAFPLSAYKGKVIFINFWATWCPPCIAEMPTIQALYDKYKDNDKVAFVILTHEKQAVAEAFMNKKQYSFPVYTSRFGAPPVLESSSIPATFVISPDGKVLIKEIGAADWNSKRMHNLIDELTKL